MLFEWEQRELLIWALVFVFFTAHHTTAFWHFYNLDDLEDWTLDSGQSRRELYLFYIYFPLSFAASFTVLFIILSFYSILFYQPFQSFSCTFYGLPNLRIAIYTWNCGTFQWIFYHYKLKYAPHTQSSTGCIDCLRMAQKIEELECRISTLYKIKEGEQLTDSLLLTTNVEAASTTQVADVTVPWNSGTVLSHIPPATANPWFKLGAKPKTMVCSTPGTSKTEPWTAVQGKKRRNRHKPPPSTIPSQPLQLKNKFEALAESDNAAVLQPPQHSITPHLRTDRRVSHGADPPVQQSPLPKTLLLGDSINRDVRGKRTITHCLPGATVNDITEKIPGILSKHPTIDKVIVHVGANDIP